MTAQFIPVSSVRERRDVVELNDDVSHSPLWNPDLAPTTIAQRTWTVWSIAALWVSIILICDYFVLRHRKLKLDELFDPRGRYTYFNGTNWRTVIALVLAVLPCLPGFLHEVKLVDSVPPILDQVYTYAWFVTFGLAFALCMLY